MPPVVLERPKMSRAMWEALKAHILKERKKIKQELEADAEVERQRKERERQVKQDSMTLSQTKHQLSSLDSRLTELKEEKHQLFLKLKKVLNEDETRRRQLLSKEAANAQHEQLMTMQNMGYNISSQGVPGGHYMQTNVGLPNRTNAGGPQLYNKVGPIIPPGSIKRSRSPSPPSIQHNYKFGPYKPPPEAIHSYPQKLQYYPPPTSQPPPQSFQPPPRQAQQQQPPPPQQQHQQLQINQVQAPPRMESSLYTYTAPPTRSPQTNREEPPKHNMPTYLHHNNQQMHRGYVLHQQQGGIEHPPQKFEDGPKYYPPPSTHQLNRPPPPHLNLHPGISIQQHQSGPTSGSITSGYPIRTVVSNFQGRPPSPHVIYTGSPRLSYNHPNQQQQQQVTVQRYSLPPHGHQRE